VFPRFNYFIFKPHVCKPKHVGLQRMEPIVSPTLTGWVGNHPAKCCLKMRNVLKNLCQYTSQVCDGLVSPRFEITIFKREVSPGWFVGFFLIFKRRPFENLLVVFEQLAHDPQVLNWRATVRTVRLVCARASLCQLLYFIAGNFRRLVCGSSAIGGGGGGVGVSDARMVCSLYQIQLDSVGIVTVS
jgi:hypothetical protein